MKRLVIIDAGHGGQDSGALSGMTLEKNVVLALSRVVYGELARKNDPELKIVMVRDADHFIGLLDRVKVANTYAAERPEAAACFVSLHINASPSASPHGYSVFHYHEAIKGQALAAEVLTGLGSTIGGQMPVYNAGVLADQTFLHKTITVLHRTAMPSCLVELGFISNAEDRALLVNPAFIKDAARGIVVGIDGWCENGQVTDV